MGRWDDLIQRLGAVRPTRRAERLYEDAANSGIFIDHARALYGPDPADHIAVEFGRQASPGDIESLKALIYQRSQQALADKPDVLRIYRGDRLHRAPEDVLSFSGRNYVANRFARPVGTAPAGVVTSYDLPRAAVLADAELAPGTFQEFEVLARLLDAEPKEILPWSPPRFP